MVDWTPIEFLDGNDGSGLELGERDRAVATSPINNVFEEKKWPRRPSGIAFTYFSADQIVSVNRI